MGTRLVGFALTLLLSSLPALPLLAQSRADSARTEAIRSRGFIRAAETQLSKVLNLLQDAPEPPPTVQDWREGEWDVLAGGFRGILDLSAKVATWEGVSAPVDVTYAGDLLEVRLAVPGYGAGGLLSLRHAEGRMIGTIAYGGQDRPASAQRRELRVVRVVVQPQCTFAEYTDGSWGHAPNIAACHQALNEYAGPLRFVGRVYVP